MTISGNDRDERLAQLAHALELYGAREERWPEAARSELVAFAAQDEAAGRLLAEARALDTLLGLAPSGAAAEGLEARILAAASTTPQQGRAAFPLRRESNRRSSMSAPRRAGGIGRIWPELSLLAASLFLGLLIGLSGQALPALQNIAFIADDDGLGTLAGLLFDPGGGPDQGAL